MMVGLRRAIHSILAGTRESSAALVTQAIVDNYDKALGNASHQSGKLSSYVHQHDIATSFMSFSTSYSDTG